MRARLRRLPALTSSDWLLAAEVVLRTAVIAIAIRCLRVEQVLQLATGAPALLRRRRASMPLARTVWLVTAVTRRLGVRCLTQSVVLHGVLAHRGVPSEIVIGAGLEAGRFRAHAWVEQGGRVISRQGADGCVSLHRHPSTHDEAVAS